MDAQVTQWLTYQTFVREMNRKYREARQQLLAKRNEYEKELAKRFNAAELKRELETQLSKEIAFAYQTPSGFVQLKERHTASHYTRDQLKTQLQAIVESDRHSWAKLSNEEWVNRLTEKLWEAKPVKDHGLSLVCGFPTSKKRKLQTSCEKK